MHKYFSYSFGLLTLVAIYSFRVTTSENQITEPPIFKKGTFWKIKNEQLADYTGGKINRFANVSCYIDRETIYNGVEVYEATYIIHEERKVSKRYIQKSNLKLLDASGMWRNYIDTMKLEYELLNFPMHQGKTWKSIIKNQRKPKGEIFISDAEFRVEAVTDTTLYIENNKIETKAYFLKGKVINHEKKTFTSQYIYIAPNKTFPGTCPVSMFEEFSKRLRRDDRHGPSYEWAFSTVDFNW